MNFDWISRRQFLARSGRLGLAAAAAAAGLGALAQACRAPGGRRLHLYNWSDYIAPEAIAGFEEEHGIQVVYDTYESDEELLAKLQAGARGYDVIVPSNSMVEILIRLDLLEPLNHDWIPGLANLAARFIDPPYDPENRFSVAYQWGTTGIAYRSDHVRTPIASWDALWDPAFAGKMTMLDDRRDAIGAALIRLGHSVNSTDPRQLEEAKRLCIEQKRMLMAYLSAPVKVPLIAGDVWVAQLWSGDTMMAAAEEPAIRYAIPGEGAALWADNMCILRSAPHRREAHLWIDYVLRPEVSAAISNTVRYATPNRAARPYVDERLRSHPGLYPPDEVQERLEWLRDIGEANRLYDRLWTEIKAA